jgi:hypothetical protein
MGETTAMTAAAAPAPAAPSASVPAAWTALPVAPARGLPSRLLAGALHVVTGLAVTASVIGIAVAQSIVMRGVVVADAGDVAMLNTLAPVVVLFGVVGMAHAAAGLGIVFGSRSAAGLGIGLGLFDLVAGIVALVLAATSPEGRFDGTTIALTFIALGIVLAVAARVADWNTHGPLVDEA